MDTIMNVAVTGANSGLGKLICERLRGIERSDSRYFFNVIEIHGPDSPQRAKAFDLGDVEDIYGAAEYIREVSSYPEDTVVYNILINCAGINYIEWFPQMDVDQYDLLQAVNVRAPILLTQELLRQNSMTMTPTWFDGSGAVLNIISNASHMPMTNSVAYNASKGALHIATLAMARELFKTHGLRVFGISPNKLKGTAMSQYIEGRVPELRGWSPEEAARYQLAALPTGEETDPATLADFIAFLLSKPSRHKYLHGCVLPYGA